MEDKKQYTYFGLEVVENESGLVGVKQSDIKKLPFFDFWYEKSKCSACAGFGEDDILVYLHDWERFSRFFIKYENKRS